MVIALPRSIIHDPTILGNRWHLAGTQIAVGEVRLDHAAGGSETDYAYPGLTARELAACLAFDFPPTREAQVAFLSGVATVACVCGEDTAVSGDLAAPVHCVCGRAWQLGLVLFPVCETGTPPTDLPTPESVATA
jgi:uncharacterized protein (DUF433 family)